MIYSYTSRFRWLFVNQTDWVHTHKKNVERKRLESGEIGLEKEKTNKEFAKSGIIAAMHAMALLAAARRLLY